MNYFGIFAALKSNLLKIKEHITKKWLIRFATCLVLTGAALLLDAYFDKNPTEFENIQSGAEEHNPNQGEVYILAPNSIFTAKTSVQKNPTKNNQLEKHTRFLRDFYSMRNSHVLKAEVIKQTTPLITSYHFLTFQAHLFPPDEDAAA